MVQSNSERSYRFLIVLLIFVASFHLVSGEECPNSTKTDCKIHQQLVTVNNCTRCICRVGYYHHHGLGGCQSCTVCTSPKAILKNCTQTSDTVCGDCPQDHYRTESGCKKCQGCEHVVLKPCGMDHNTICALNVTSPTIHLETATIHSNCTESQTQVDNDSIYSAREQRFLGAKKDWRENHIWHILFIIETVIVFVALVMCVMCRNYSRQLYVLAETSSLATSISSLLFSKSKDITALTEAERETLIQDLPGGYAEILGHLLNPNVSNNWVQLAYEFKFTLNQVANLKNASNHEYTQALLLNLGTRNATVEILWRGLKNIKRDDACTALVNFMLDLRKDDESAVVIMNTKKYRLYG